MDIAATIIPIFIIIILGWLARRKGFLPPEFLNPANRLVYYIAIPAMIFNTLSQATLSNQLNPVIIMTTLLAVVGAYFAAGLLSKGVGVSPYQRGTFIQCAAHGNLGYIGLAVAYYFMGEDGLARAGIMAGFIMVVQNFLSVIVLLICAESKQTQGRGRQLIVKIIGNPVILSAMGGILFSYTGLSLPLVIGRSLKILGGLALPTALLLIGATLSFNLIRYYLKIVLIAATIKLALLPAIGWLLYLALHIPASDYMPALILLASPTATVAYVMSKEMQGDPEVAVATISAATLLSAVTFIFWLHQGAG